MSLVQPILFTPTVYYCNHIHAELLKMIKTYLTLVKNLVLVHYLNRLDEWAEWEINYLGKGQGKDQGQKGKGKGKGCHRCGKADHQKKGCKELEDWKKKNDKERAARGEAPFVPREKGTSPRRAGQGIGSMEPEDDQEESDYVRA